MHGASTYPNPTTLWDLRAHSGRVALVEDGRLVAYDELADLSDRIAQAVPQSRSLVFCLCSNTVGSVAAYLGFMNHGTVPLLLDVGIERDLLGDLIERYRPSYLWVPDAQVESFAGMGDLFSCEGTGCLPPGSGPPPCYPTSSLCSCRPRGRPAALSSCAFPPQTCGPTPTPSWSTCASNPTTAPSPRCR